MDINLWSFCPNESIRRVKDERLSGIGGVTESDTPEYLWQGHFVHHKSVWTGSRQTAASDLSRTLAPKWVRQNSRGYGVFAI